MNGVAPGCGRSLDPWFARRRSRRWLLISQNRAPHFLLASLAAAYDYDWIGAEAQFRLAAGRHVGVGSAVRWAYSSFYLQPLGRFQEAVAQMERAVEHDPLNVVWRGVLGSHLTHAQLSTAPLSKPTRRRRLMRPTGFPISPWAKRTSVWVGGRRLLMSLKGPIDSLLTDALATGTLAGALGRIGEKDAVRKADPRNGRAPTPSASAECCITCCAGDWSWPLTGTNARSTERDPFTLIFAPVTLAGALRASSGWPKLARMMNLPDAAVYTGLAKGA